MNRNLFILFSALLAANAAFAEPPERTVTVQGEGKIEVTPDQAVLPISLETKEKSLRLAKEKNDAQVASVLKVAAKFSIPKEKIRTMGLMIEPQYRPAANNRQQLFDGYEVSRSLELTIDNMDRAEEVIAALTKAGIDHVDGIRFTFSNPKANEAAARKAAMEDAHAKAEALAEAGGAKLGPVMTIELQGANIRPPFPRPMMMAAMAASAPTPPVLAGTETIEQQVTVIYALQ